MNITVSLSTRLRTALLCLGSLGTLSGGLALAQLQPSQVQSQFEPLVVNVRPASKPATPTIFLTTPAPTVTPLAPSISTSPTSVTPLADSIATPSRGYTPYTPATQLTPQQTYLSDIGLTRAWAERGLVSAPITVAVLDTGYTPHPQLKGRMINGYDFVSDPVRAGDGNGRDRDASGLGQFAFHSEMIAGLIGADHSSGAASMAGINPAARVVAVRVADTSGMINVNDLADGLRWAAGLPVAGAPRNPNPARIINTSLFADWLPDNGCDPRIAAAVDDVTRAGALVVVAAGNEDRDAGQLSPAGCEGVLTVGGVQDGQRPDYANWGPVIALAAPSGDEWRGLLVSTALDERGKPAPLHPMQQNGTSFAAPQVSGAASLLLGLRPDLTPAQLREALVQTTTPWSAGTCDPDPLKGCGAGVLNIATALDWVNRLP